MNMDNMKEPGKRGVPAWFIVFCCFIALVVLFTGLHSVIFTGWFLPNHYPGDYGFFEPVRPDMISAYWNWPPGRVLILLNLGGVALICFVLYVFMPRINHRKPGEKREECKRKP